MFRDTQQIVVCILAGGMVAGFVVFRYLPLRKKMQAVNEARAAQVLAVGKVRAESEQLPAFEQRLKQLNNKVGDFDAKIPNHRDIGAFLHEIAELMNEHNLRNQQIQPGNEAESEGLHCIPVSMSCKGKLSHVFDFFVSLQSLGRLVRIERVRLQNDTEFSGDLSMHTEAVIYYSTQTQS